MQFCQNIIICIFFSHFITFYTILKKIIVDFSSKIRHNSTSTFPWREIILLVPASHQMLNIAAEVNSKQDKLLAVAYWLSGASSQ